MRILFTHVQSKQIPESRGLFVIILLADMLNTIIREIIIVANNDPETSALVAVIMFGLVAVLFFGTLALGHFIYLCVYKHHYSSFIASAIQTLGALLYFYGDNVTYILGQYGPELGCNEDCVTSNRIAASFSLGVALIIFQLVPSLIHKLIKMTKGKSQTDSYPNWLAAIDMVTVLVKMDTLFSAVVVMVESPDFCSRSDIATSVSFIIACMIIGIFAEIIYWLYALHSNKDKEIMFTGLVTAGLFVMMISFPMYILADNHQPLDCAFGCDSFAANRTINSMNCNKVANASTRLGFTTITFTLIAVISPIYFICQKRNSNKIVKATEDIEMIEHTELKT